MGRFNVPKCSSSTKSTWNRARYSDGKWRETFQQFAKQNKLSSTDWYQLSSSSLDEKTNQLVSEHFGGNLYRALSTIFPETDWKAWRFQHYRVPPNFWKEHSNQRKFFDDLGHQLGIKNLDDWYQVSLQKEVAKHRGAKAIQQAPTAALMASYPEHNWIPWKFHVAKGCWDDKSNQRKFFDELGKQLGVEKLDDWYSKLNSEVVAKNGGTSLIARYENSAATALMAIYPEHKWIPWKFHHVPNGFWDSKDNIQKFLDDLAEKLSIKNLDDWYSVRTDSLLHQGASTLMAKYKGLYNILKQQYPHHPWDRTKFKQVQKVRHASNEEWRSLFEQCKLSPEEWYQTKLESLERSIQTIVLKYFGGNLYQALSTVFPETEWKAWRFQHQQVPKNFWKEQSNQRKFFDDLGKELGIKNLDDWYEVLSGQIIANFGGHQVIQDKPGAALMAAYPEHNWIPWKFKRVFVGYWKDLSNQRKFFDDLGKQLGVEKLDDWYLKLSRNVVLKNGGGGLLTRLYNGSPTAALMAAYPEHNWIPWKFTVARRGSWNSPETVRTFLNELSEKFSIQTLDDWYLVDQQILKQYGAAGLLEKYNGLYNILKEQYPHHPWNRSKFKQPGKKAQRWLAVTLKKMFPNEEILEDYMHPKAVFPTSKRPIQLDIYIPSRSLAFEYQGQQHYQDVTSIFSPTKNYQQRDEEKRAVCAANNIKLIEVPYWWNRTQEDLHEIMQKSG